MTTLSFLIALAALSVGTYAMRFAGVKVGAAIATRGSKGSKGSGGSQPTAEGSTPADSTLGDSTSDDSTPAVTQWMDKATVVLIAAVCATTAIFDGQSLADPARLIGVGVGILASILRVPMLLCVVAGMAVCALVRLTGVL